MLRELNAIHAEREKQLSRWVRDFPGGVHIATSQTTDTILMAVKTARNLGHAVVVVADDREVRFYALPLARGN